MAVGDRIKRIRNLRGLTQKELGMSIGFDEKTADVRMAQYESGTRTPKEEMLKKIAKVLDVNFRSIYEPTLYSAEDVMYTLFELDEQYNGLTIYDVEDNSDPYYPEKHKSICFNARILDDLFAEWQIRKQELAEGKITREEYIEWKINWPQTTDDCGKNKLSKKWRK